MDNSILLGVSLGFVIGAAIVVALVAYAAWSRNKNRFDIPKYLPRDDERIWAQAMVSPKRIWALNRCKYLEYDNWDLGILRVKFGILKAYDFRPKFGNLVIVPKKWGGYHACVITRELECSEGDQRFITVYLGEFDAKELVIYDGRDRSRAEVIH